MEFWKIKLAKICGISGGKQRAKGREQGAGSREQGVGSREQGAGSKKLNEY
jgi:hypothetical protein